MIETVDDAAQVANAVAFGVAKTARVDLVDNGAAPPMLMAGGWL